MGKNYTDVVIDDKVYTIGCEQDSAYMQRLAEYVNEKLSQLRSQPGFNKQPYGSRQMLILMNIADDYLQARIRCDELEKKYAEQESDYYRLKREMVNRKLEMDQLRLQNQVLSMGFTGNDSAREKLMSDVIQSVQKNKDIKPPQTVPAYHAEKHEEN